MMRHRKIRRFRHRTNGRNFHSRNNERDQNRLSSNSLINGRIRNNFKSAQSAEKLVEKYNAMAREALSSGDKILSENYFQHADHFMRIIEGKNLAQGQDKIQTNQQIKPLDQNTKENIEEKKE